MMNKIRFTLKSKQRPKLAQEIGNILGTAPHYERVPSCAYDIAGYRLNKEAVLISCLPTLCPASNQAIIV